jgi:hypothetical protein
MFLAFHEWRPVAGPWQPERSPPELHAGAAPEPPLRRERPACWARQVVWHRPLERGGLRVPDLAVRRGGIDGRRSRRLVRHTEWAILRASGRLIRHIVLVRRIRPGLAFLNVMGGLSASGRRRPGARGGLARLTALGAFGLGARVAVDFVTYSWPLRPFELAEDAVELPLDLFEAALSVVRRGRIGWEQGNQPALNLRGDGGTGYSVRGAVSRRRFAVSARAPARASPGCRGRFRGRRRGGRRGRFRGESRGGRRGRLRATCGCG